VRIRVVRVIVVGVLMLGAPACGSGEDEGGARTLNWYVFNEPGGAYDEAAKRCSEESGGRYRINYVRLPTDANQQRELIVRRLAAEDSDIDLVGMDVIWTAELAEAGWIREWTGDRARRATEGRLQGPVRTVQYLGKVWGAPFTTNTQLLWYRKDLVKQVPRTWDELIEEASSQRKGVEVQGNQYEGLTVWVNALIASAGGQIVDEQGNVKVDDDSARRAAEIVNRLATSPAAPPGMATNKEDEGRLGFESGRSNFQINYTFIYASAAEKKGFQEKIGWARYPEAVPGRPSRPPLGGINLGVGAFSENPDLAFEAALCLTQPANQLVASEKGGLPPTSEALYDDAKLKETFPFSDLLRSSIDEGSPRPVNPAYSDISLAIQKTYHPPDGIEPDGIPEKLRERLDKAAEGKVF
jgi:multiple sugar transport system substrate-binding protein